MPISTRAGHARRSFLAAGFGLLMVLTACESAVEQSAGGGGGATDPQPGGTLTIASSSDAQPNALLAQRAGNATWRYLVFETLTRFDAERQPQPLLAEDWEVSQDELTMTLQLRDDVLFHSGRAMTAEDVVFSLQQVQDPVSASQVRTVAEQITDMSATGEHEVTLQFARPLPAIFDVFELTPVVDPETYGQITSGEQVIGTGPFTWESWQPGASLSLARFEDYWQEDLPYLEGVDISVITDSTALLSAVQTGSADVAAGMIPRDAVPLAAGDGFELLEGGGTVYLYGMDVTAEPFDDPRVRQAVGYAIDRERILEQVFQGQGEATDLWWSPDEAGYSEELATTYTYDPERARQLIEEAGATGAEVPMAVPAIPAPQGIGEIIQFNLEEIGLRPTPAVLDVAQFDSRQVAGDLGQSFNLLHGLVGFSAPTLLDAMPSLRAGNPSNFDTPEYQTLRQAVQEAGDDDERAAAVADLSQYLLDQAFSQVLVQSPNLFVTSDEVQGLEANVLGGLIVTDTYLQQ